MSVSLLLSRGGGVRQGRSPPPSPLGLAPPRPKGITLISPPSRHFQQNSLSPGQFLAGRLRGGGGSGSIRWGHAQFEPPPPHPQYPSSPAPSPSSENSCFSPGLDPRPSADPRQKWGGGLWHVAHEHPSRPSGRAGPSRPRPPAVAMTGRWGCRRRGGRVSAQLGRCHMPGPPLGAGSTSSCPPSSSSSLWKQLGGGGRPGLC